MPASQADIPYPSLRGAKLLRGMVLNAASPRLPHVGSGSNADLTDPKSNFRFARITDAAITVAGPFRARDGSFVLLKSTMQVRALCSE